MKKVIYMAIVIAIFTGCKPNENDEKTTEEKRIAVTLSEVKSERLEVNLRYSGSIEASQTIPLNFHTAGTVEKVFADAGDFVKKGQLLATLEKKDLQNMNDIAKAKYQQAKDAYDRLKTMHDKGSISDIKWIEMETNFEQAKSSLELSANNLEKCYLKSPIDATVGKRNIEPGMSSINITSSSFELVEITSVFVKISVPENEIGKMKKGIKAGFTVSALNGKKYEGEITKVSQVAEIFSRTYTVKISVKNPNLELKPGMVCDVALNLNSEKEVVFVPYQCVSKDKEGNAFVLLVDENQKKAKKQIVITGNYQGNDLEILSGLTQGQKIVNEGKEKLSDNSLISF